MQFRAKHAVIAAGAVAGIVLVSRRRPCPAWLAGWLENPLTAMLPPSLDRLQLAPGMRVLDIGSGPGRIAIPAARAVRPAGRVVALDLQPEMLDRLARRAARSGVSNIEPLAADIATAPLAPESFDRAILATVLGEVHDREAAIRAIATALKPGGILSVTEIFGDPHYQSREAVRRLGENAGLRLSAEFGSWIAFTMNFEK